MDPQVIAFIESLSLDLISWFRKRHADAGELPTDDEVVARVKAKLAAGNAEGDAFEREHPAT